MRSTLRNIFIIALVSITCFSCCSTKEITEVKPVVIHPTVIEDTVKVTSRTDSVIIGVETIRNDTVMIVKYFPEYQKFYVKAKPDSILFFDTTHIVEYVTKEESFWDLKTLLYIGLIVVILTIIILRK